MALEIRHGYLRERASASARRSLALNSHCLLRATRISHKQQSKNVHSPYPDIFVSEAGGEWEGVPSYVFAASCPASGNPSEICCKLTAFRCQPSRASLAKQGENQEYIDLFSLSRQSLQNKQCFHNQFYAYLSAACNSLGEIFLENWRTF